MGKFLGYVFSLVGLIAIALTVEQVAGILPFTAPEFLTVNYLMYGGGALVIIGLILILKGGKKYSKKTSRGSEVPIYHKGNLVGYRRH